MRNRLFIHGRRLARYIKEDGRGRNGEYFSVELGDKSVPMRITHLEIGTEIICGCKHCSIHDNKYWCAFKSGLVIFKAELR